jgi:hypothetical protein
MLLKTTFRRLFAVAVMLGVLAAASPAASLADNIGSGP